MSMGGDMKAAFEEAGHPEYLKLLDEMRELHCRKAADYGRGQDPLANCRGSLEFGVPAWVGTMIRAMDKVHRIKSFIANGSLKNESVEDSLKDLAAYALIALVLFRETESSSESPPLTLRPRVYIAGPISKGSLAMNVNLATDAFHALLKMGFAPLCPHWSCFADGVTAAFVGTGAEERPVAFAERGPRGTTHEDWLAVDLPWVRAAHAVLRLPGESKGADLEVATAQESGIPVFTEIADLVAWRDRG